MFLLVSSGDFFGTYGGGQVYVRNLTDEYIRQGEEFAVISCSPAFPLHPERQDYKGVSVYQIHPRGNIKSLLGELNPDIVHINGEKSLFARLCKELGIPSIVTAHHGGILCPEGAMLNTQDEICHIKANYNDCLHCYLRNIPTGLFWYPLLRHYIQNHYCKIGTWLRKRRFIPFLSPIGEAGLSVTEKLKAWQQLTEDTDMFVAPSNAMAEALIRNGLPKSKITVVPHGIPRPQEAVQHAVPYPSIHFYYAGRISYVKGIHILLEAFHRATCHWQTDSPNSQTPTLHLIGGADTKSERRYQKYLQRKYHKDCNIIWHGKIPADQVFNETKEYAVMLHSAIFLESFGLNIAEALSQGHWVIATRCGGAEMQIQEGVNGTLVLPNDIFAFQTAIENYLQHPQMSSSTSVVSITTHVHTLLNLYHSL